MSRDAPTAVLQAALQSIVGGLAKQATDGEQEFRASAAFTGAKPGFYFSRGPKGVGYYADPKQTKPAEREKEETPQKPHAAPIDPEQLLREAEEQAGETGAADQVQLLDAKGLKRLILSFERKYKENLEMRMKHADDPQKFLASEVDLDEEVHRLSAIAGSPELYPELVRLGGIPPILTLLSHDNGDIAAAAVELLREMTDADVVEDSEEEARALVAAMVEGGALESIVQRLVGFNEASDDEAEAVANSLSLLENMVELDAQVAEQLVQRTKVLRWVLARLKPREWDTNKGLVGEALAALLQASPAAAQALAALNGIDALLQAIAPYKNRPANSEAEGEYVENLFDALCCTLMSAENRRLFVEAEGVELMVLILRQRRPVRASALKALDFACTRCAAACERFVDVLGLKTLFSIYMGRSKVKWRKGEEGAEAAEEERVVSVIASLLSSITRGSRRERVCAKFVEAEFEKCDRLVELYTRYDARVRAEEERLAAMADEDAEEVDDNYLLFARMEAGLYTAQQACVIMGHLWATGDLGLRKRLLLLLHQQGLVLEGVRRKLKELHDAVGKEGGPEEAESARGLIRPLMVALGHEEHEQTRGAQAPPTEEVIEMEVAGPDLAAATDSVAAEPHPNSGNIGEGEIDADPFCLNSLPAQEGFAATTSSYMGGARERAEMEEGEAHGRVDKEDSRRHHSQKEERHRARKERPHKEGREHKDHRDREHDADRERRHHKRSAVNREAREEHKRERHL